MVNAVAFALGESENPTSWNYMIAICCTALVFFINTVGNVKASNPNNHPQEDAVLGIGDGRRQQFEQRVQAQGGVDRWTRIAANQGENFPFHMWVLWAAMIAGGNQDILAILFIGWLSFRIIFVIFYLYAVAPHRTVVFVFAQLTVMSSGIVGISGAGSEDLDSSTYLFRVTGVSMTLLFWLLNFTARFKSIDPNNHPAEDAALGVTDERRQQYKETQQGPNRWHQIAENQAEGIPMACAVLFGAYAVGTDPLIAAVLCQVYAFLRLMYVICYVFSLQPFRSLTWGFSNITCIVAGVMGLIAAHSNMSLLGMMMGTLLLWFLNVVAVVKSANPNNHPAEDASIGLDDSRKEAYAQRVAAQGGFDRWTRIAINQLENIPVALVCLWGASNAGGDLMPISICFLAFALFRFFFVVCYLMALSPWRSIVFGLSQVTILVVCGIAISRAANAWPSGLMPLS